MKFMAVLLEDRALPLSLFLYQAKCTLLYCAVNSSPCRGPTALINFYLIWCPVQWNDSVYNNLNFLLDYILAYEIDTGKDEDWQQKREEKRREFEANLEKAHLELEAEGIEVRKNQWR